MTKQIFLKAFAMAIFLNNAVLGSDIFSTDSATQQQTPLRERTEFKKYFTGQKPEFIMPEFLLDTSSKDAMMQSFFQIPASETIDCVLQYAGKCTKEECDLGPIIRHLTYLNDNGEASGAELFNILVRIQAAQSRNISTTEQDLFSHLGGFGEIMQGLTKDDAWKSTRAMSSNIFEALTSSSKFAVRLGGIHPYYTFKSSQEAHHKAYDVFEKELDAHLGSAMSIIPVLDRGFLGFHYLIDSLINDHFPVAFPSAKPKLSAHGIENLSPLGFTLHDLAHIELYGKRAALKKYGGTLFQELTDKKIPYKTATEIVIKRVVAMEQLLKETLRQALETIDQKAELNQISQIEYAKALHGFFHLLHENPFFFGPLLEATSFSDLLRKAGKIDDFDAENFQGRLLSFAALNPLGTSHINGSTELSDEQIITQIMSEKSKFESFKIGKFDSFEASDVIDQEKTKVHRSAFSIDVELHFANGNNVFFAFSTLHQLYLNMFHSVSSLAPFWAEASTLDKDTSDQDLAYTNMAKITTQIQQSIIYFLDQINTVELNNFYTAASSQIQRDFEEEVRDATPSIVHTPVHQEVASSSTGLSYTTTYVSNEARLEIENRLLKELLADKKTPTPKISLKSEGPVNMTITFGDEEYPSQPCPGN